MYLKRKSDVVTRTWHDVHDRFSDPIALKRKLMDTLYMLNMMKVCMDIQGTTTRDTLSAGLKLRKT